VDKGLKILILEDVPEDAALIEHELREGGVTFISVRVGTRADFLKELKDFTPDLILADYKVPQFDGLTAMALVKEECPGIPFIFILGTVSDDFAKETVKNGATDYVLKNRLARLVPAVTRAMREAEVGRERKLAEEALKESEEKLRYIIEHSNELFYIHDTQHKFTFVSPQSLTVLGYTPDEMTIEWTKLLTENPVNEQGLEITTKALKTGERQPPYILEVYTKDRRKIILEIDESPLKNKQGIVTGIVGAARDVTERINTEAFLKKNEKELKKRIGELEDFYNIAVNRELRMMELKREIDELKAELEKCRK